MPKNKNARRELAIAKEKRKKKIIIASVAAVVLVVVAIGVFIAIQRAGTETYSDGYQTIQLLSNGTFTARLSHGQNYSGNYTKTNQGGVTVVAFSSGGATVVGEIEDGLLHLPHEWDDGHGHGDVLTKQ